jgi:hypothetical protein
MVIEDLPDGGGSELVSEAEEFAVDASVVGPQNSIRV